MLKFPLPIGERVRVRGDEIAGEKRASPRGIHFDRRYLKFEGLIIYLKEGQTFCRDGGAGKLSIFGKQNLF